MNKDIKIILPPKLYICSSRENQTIQTDREEFNIFYANIIQPYSEDFDVFVNCEYGENLGHCWRIDQLLDSGTVFPLEIKVYDAYGACLAEKKTMVEAVAKQRCGEAFRVLAVGDSMTRSAKYLAHLATKLYGIEFVGSRSFDKTIYHEGRGGWSFENYFRGTREKGSVTSPFLFPKGVSGKEYFGDLGYHRDIADALHDPYQFDGFKVELPKDGQIVTDKNEAFRFEHGKMTQLEKTVLWEFSFSKYIERQGLTDLNAVTILMGANDLQICPYEESDKRIAKFIDNMERFVQSLREYSAALPIVINLPVLGAEQHAWGKQLGCRGTQKMYRFNILRANQMLIEAYGNRENEFIFLSPMFLNLDPEYGFPKEGYRANKYAEDVVEHQSNWVHPNEQGYCQMGDVLGGVLEKIRGLSSTKGGG